MCTRRRRCWRRGELALGAGVLAAGLLAGAAGCSGQDRAEPLPGARLLAQTEVRVNEARKELRQSITHYGLVFAVTPEDFASFGRQLMARSDGRDLVMGSLHGVELHGGGVLGAILGFWTPGERPARLEDRFPFAWSPRAVALREIYRSHRQQIYLPVPGRAFQEIQGKLPGQPQLPRMHLAFRPAVDGATSADVDAYAFLRTLLEREPSLHAAWTTRAGQRLTADLLLRHVGDLYLSQRTVGDEAADHSHLHLVELLLDYARHRPGAVDPNAVKRRFLEVELQRQEFGEAGPSEALGHYAESLGLLLQDPDVAWTAGEKSRVRSWLQALETSGAFGDRAEPQHAAHLLAGLRLVERQRAKLR
jgi:hypothetical protein